MGLQRCLDNLNIFCKQWKLQVNLSKTKVIIFRRRCGHEISRFEIGNNVLEVVHSYKYLGLIVSSNGSFTDGITDLAQKPRKSWDALRNKLHLELWNNPAVVLKLFDAIVKPILTFQIQTYKNVIVWNLKNFIIQFVNRY